MNDPAAIVKTFFDQAKAAVKAQHDAYQLVVRSQKTMLDSMRSMGPPFEAASTQFDKMIEFQSQQYAAAVSHMDQMFAEWQNMVAQGGKKPK